MDRPRNERFKYTDLAERFIETGGGWRLSKPRVHAPDSAHHHFVLDFGTNQVDVVCSEILVEEFLLPEGETSAEGIGLEDGTIRYVDLGKRDNVLVSRIRRECTLSVSESKERELWLVIFFQSRMVRLGDYLYMGAHKSTPAIIKARDYVRSHGAGSFDRMYYFSLPSGTADYVGPLVGSPSNSALEWRVFEYGESGFRIELPGQPVVREEDFESRSVSLELTIESISITVAFAKRLERRALDSTIEQFHTITREIYNLPIIDSRSFLWKGHPASDLVMGEPGHYVLTRIIVAHDCTLVALVDSQLPLNDSPIATRVFESIALLSL